MSKLRGFYGSHETFNSDDLKNVKLPEKFLCRLCDKLKSPPQFSNRELNTFRYKKGNGISVNYISAKLRCRICSGDQCHELECNGPCGFYKSVNEFSKNQRRRPEVAWCELCTEWREAAEPGIHAPAAPNTELDPDEDDQLAMEFDAARIFGPEGDEDSDSDSYGDQEDNDLSWMGGANDMKKSNRADASATASDLLIETTETHTHGAASSGSRAAQSNGVFAPNLRTRRASFNSIGATASSASNPYEDDFETTEGDTVSNSTNRGNQRVSQSGKPYNAWGPNGIQTTRYQSLFPTSSRTSSAMRSTVNSASSINGSPGPSISRQGSESKWPKHVVRKSGPKAFPKVSRAIQQSRINDNDDDESQYEL